MNEKSVVKDGRVVVKERPILMSGAMVPPTLSGLKTQTRRIIKGADRFPDIVSWERWIVDGELQFRDSGVPLWLSEEDNGDAREWACSYGDPGDRLWVRETWAVSGWYKNPAGGDPLPRYEYRAFPADGTDFRCVSSWKPSIHMPRLASRITLEILSIRIQRLQEITEADAIAEGIQLVAPGLWKNYMCSDPTGNPYTNPVCSYITLWEKINGAGSWDANHWVAAIEFKKLEAPNA